MKRAAFAFALSLATASFALAGPRYPVAAAGPSSCGGDQPGMANPAAVYCRDLGYNYEVVNGARGEQGVCALPDGSRCDEWEFLEGTCGQAYSYCAKQGMNMTTRTDGNDPFTREYGVCVRGKQQVGPVTGLMGLSQKAAVGTPRPAPSGAGAAPLTSTAPQAASSGSFDWRNENGEDWMTSVKNQGICGACWAFSAVGVAEATTKIRRSDPNLYIDLSEEYLVSGCYGGQTGCCGGDPAVALDSIAASGIPDEACLPYVDGDADGCACNGDGSCNASMCTYAVDACSDKTCSDRCSNWQSRMVGTGPETLVPPDADSIKNVLITNGPLSAVMGIGGEVGGHFDGDIYRCSDDSDSNHAVVIVGFDDAGGYWIVKNSWGATWGPELDGYFKVGYGECAIESYVHAVLPVPGVGGLAEAPDVMAATPQTAGPPWTEIAAVLAAGVVVVAAGGWYARRRYSVRRR